MRHAAMGTTASALPLCCAADLFSSAPSAELPALPHLPPPHCVCLARLQLLIAAVDDTKADVSFEARLRLAQHVPGSEPNHLLVKVW